MAIRVFDYGAEDILNVYFNGGVAQTGFWLMLYTSPTGTLSDTSVLVEATGGGYGRQSIDASEVAVALPTGGAYPTGIPTATFTDQLFAFSGPLTTNLTIYGYALLKGTAGYSATHSLSDVIFADKLVNPFTPAAGDSLTLSIKFQLGNGTPA